MVLSQATGTAETEAALTMLERVPTARRITVGADKGYDTREFVTTCRSFEITPHVAMKQRYSALDRRTSRHAGYAASQWVRKRVEEVFGWLKTVGGGRKLRYCGVARNGFWAEMALAATTSCAWPSSCPCHHHRGRSLPVEDEMPQPEEPAARSGAIQGSAYSESASNGASMPTTSRSRCPKLAFFISLLDPTTHLLTEHQTG